jgi:predicted metalloprotease with PDZ domain
MTTRRCLVVLLLAFLLRSSIPASAQSEETLQVGGGTIRVELQPGEPLPAEAVVGWVRRAAVALSSYFGHYPVKHLLITVKSGGDGAVSGGVTYGNSHIEVRLGRETTDADLRRDWVLTHEMFHLAFPTLDRRYLWMNEGLSDYLEPVARARVGQLTAEQVWHDMVEGLPQGLPEPGDEGLDHTHTWGRTYWGGDLFWFLADVRVHVQTNNRRSIDDAIRSILAEGGDGAVNWTLEQVLTAADKATGTTVFKDLHDELGPQPGHVDLDQLWKKLGVQYHRGRVRFDDSAPWAKIRAAITAP